ncbi:MAG: hypothetical protein NZ602_14920 [Thermoguttaceae bacterium]|nr:hypothetical protein [Thermoguttaceae bacterium]MDW8038484.1 hypothetical protein [Thermoguttaceae bacterium]
MPPPAEDLLGYLLDALEEPERQQVHAALAQQESLQQQLEDLRRLISFLELAHQMPEPPPGLAERTCQWITAVTTTLPNRPIPLPERPRAEQMVQHQEGCFSETEVAGAVVGQNSSDLADPPRPSLQNPWLYAGSVSRELEGPCSDGPVSTHQAGLPLRPKAWQEAAGLAGRATGWRWPDLLVAAAVSILLVLVLFGAIYYSRLRYEITQCQENLRRLGGGLIQYSEFHQGQFPAIPTDGPLAVTGMYGPILISEGFVQDQQAFWCPGAVRRGVAPVPIPTVAQLERIAPEQWQALLPRLGGAYGYSLGYIESGQYRPPRNRHRSYFAVLADAPSPEHPDWQSFHHGGEGQNVFFEDGHVQFVVGCRLPPSTDHFFLNHQGFLAPGIGPEDAVVAPATARPQVPAISSRTQ